MTRVCASSSPLPAALRLQIEVGCAAKGMHCEHRYPDSSWISAPLQPLHTAGHVHVCGLSNVCTTLVCQVNCSNELE